ncbi:MAG: monovalent cation/H+ antiporter subunit D family protein [Acidobacteriota bacterium]
MITAPLCVLVRHRRFAWAIATAVTWCTFVLALALLELVLETGTLSYAVGGWPPPWGIELRVEPVNAWVLFIVSGVSAVVLTAAPRSFNQEVPHGRHYLAYGTFLLCMTGLLGMASAGDAFNVFVFLEISSLSAYALVALGRSRRALTSAFRYLMMGTTGGTFILLGVGLLYAATGTLNLHDLSQRLVGLEDSRTVLVALACIVVGTTIKLALLPLGAWLPNAYTFAPSVVTAFLAATATKVAYYVLVRFVYRVFGTEVAFERLHLDDVLLPLALVSMFLGSVLAIYEPDVKRLLAYSSLAQIGYMVLGLALASSTGLTGGIVHLFNHALMKSGLFLVLACIALRVGGTRLDDFAGLGRCMPWTAGLFVVGGCSLIGVPLTVGFVSKWYLVRAALEQGRGLIAFLILVSSLLSLAYVWKVVETLYFRAGPSPRTIREAPLGLLLPAAFLIVATVYFGIFTEDTVGVAVHAAELLIEGPLPVDSATVVGASP